MLWFISVFGTRPPLAKGQRLSCTIIPAVMSCLASGMTDVELLPTASLCGCGCLCSLAGSLHTAVVHHLISPTVYLPPVDLHSLTYHCTHYVSCSIELPLHTHCFLRPLAFPDEIPAYLSITSTPCHLAPVCVTT